MSHYIIKNIAKKQGLAKYLFVAVAMFGMIAIVFSSGLLAGKAYAQSPAPPPPAPIKIEGNQSCPDGMERKYLGSGLYCVAMAPIVSPNATQGSGQNCDVQTFFGLQPWYKYLRFHTNNGIVDCSSPELSQDGRGIDLKSIWLIGLVVVENLLRIAGMVALVFIFYGGFQYITSQGEPEKAKAARGTIINALIGVAIAILAVVVVNFVAATLTRSA